MKITGTPTPNIGPIARPDSRTLTRLFSALITERDNGLATAGSQNALNPETRND